VSAAAANAEVHDELSADVARTSAWKRVSNSLRPERVYLALALVFGGLFPVVTPPFQVPDEENHFRRAFELAEGRVIAVKRGDYTGDSLPRGIGELWGRFSQLRQHPEEKTSAAEIAAAESVGYSPDEREFAAFSNTAVHPPLTYVPQILGILIARLFSPSVLVGFYAGRVLNFLTATALTFLAIRLSPVARWAITALALTPMALYQSASVSSDALTNALSFVLVAQVLACALGPTERLSARSILAIALLSAAVALAKQAYFLLPLAYFLIPVRKMGSRGRYWTGFALVMLSSLVPLLAWGLVVRNVYSPPDLRYAVDPSVLLHQMISKPGQFFQLLAGTVGHAPVYAEEYLGFLGWLDTRLPTWLYIAEAALLLFVCLSDFDPRNSLTTRQAWFAALLALLAGVMVFAVVHLTWDSVDAKYIVIQGRHLIPLGPLAAVALTRLGMAIFGKSRIVQRDWSPIAVTLVVPVVLSVAVVCLYDRFYRDTDLARAERLYQRGQSLLKEPGQQEQAIALFHQTLEIDPGHPGAHYMLGLRDSANRPREAAAHFRAALVRAPQHASTLARLGGVLADLGDYREAIECYEEALRVRPDDESFKSDLAQIRRMRDFLNQINSIVLRLAQDNVEERNADNHRQGTFLKVNRGPIVEPAARRSLPVPFVWRCPPPGGGRIRLSGPGGESDEGRREPFFACSTVSSGNRRVFVFPMPVGARLIADEDVSWFYQRPIADLDDSQRQGEAAYRTAHGLQFPLLHLPD
jgi:uncharacterized membrane protein